MLLWRGLLCFEWLSEMNKSRADPLVTKFWHPHCVDRTWPESQPVPGALHIRFLSSALWPEKEGLDGMGLSLGMVLVTALWLDHSFRGCHGISPQLQLSESMWKLCFSILYSTISLQGMWSPAACQAWESGEGQVGQWSGQVRSRLLSVCSPRGIQAQPTSESRITAEET